MMCALSGDVASRWALAEEFLSDARALLQEGRLRSAMSRAYYAAYHACICAMEWLGYRPEHFRGRDGLPADRWDHRLVRTEFHRIFVLTRHVIPWRLGVGVRMLWRMRVEADYDPAATVPNERAEEAVSLASEF